nr:immunoglobulin heavy chain junction region [Mus musculus]MBK4187724.1 immunoglobulin heavy chain junction region [Mus musculus]MBK4187725.1 immunoglobulin heavy chain junction region [Mus musculus]MBK4187726.1 immunoglobulin heavy chain junction region [Mus musculus]MBK4187727.1 immunoglobulin heavy chain junction region [Mus musculus]
CARAPIYDGYYFDYW